EKPAHAAFTSKAGQDNPSFCWTNTAVAGNGTSPVTLAQTIRSICSAEIWAVARAILDASTARSDVRVPSSAKRRASIPVRSRIHSSDVSMRDSNHVFGTTRGGSDEPTPVMVACLVTGPRISDARSSARERGACVAGRADGSSGRGGFDPLHQLRQDVAGPGLEEGGGAGRGEGPDPALPSHRGDHLALEELPEPAAVRHELAGDVLRHRDRRIPYLDPIEDLAHGLDRRPHQLAVEGPRHGEADRTDL